ncbi:MAG: amino acid permease [Victivallales bacterium]|nr:amino acid permease [Victivallales bacterium]MCF7889051.1 amino acid permease [Victivallales bacterium]
MGTEIGVGMLALPILIVHFGILPGFVILIFAWLLMLYTALLICEINSTISGNAGFASIAKEFFGKWGKFFITVVFWFTLSSIAMAYISAAGSTFCYMLSESADLTSALFVLVFGTFITLGTRTVDYINRFLFGATLLAFFSAVYMLLISLNTANLIIFRGFSPVLFSIPPIATAFILHNIIPSIRTYLGYDKKVLKRVVFIGSLIPLFMYILWVTVIIGNIPMEGTDGFSVLFDKGSKANIGDLLNLLYHNTNNKFVMLSINSVAAISVITSFLGTSISLYHFIQDVFGHVRKNFTTHFAVPVIMTFIIPLLTVITFPDVFILALSYAGTGAMILFVLLPIIIVKGLNKTDHDFSVNVLNNKCFLIPAFLAGISIVCLQFF